MPANPERRTFTRRQILVAGAAGIGAALAATLGVSAAIAPAERVLRPTTTEKQASPTIINPSFEDGISTPTGWRTISHLSDVQTWESGIAHTGNRCVSITGPTWINAIVQWESIDLISVRPGQVYTLSVWARSEGLFDSNTGWGGVLMWYCDAAGNYLDWNLNYCSKNPLNCGGWIPLRRPAPTAAWQLYPGSFTVPQNAASVRLNMYYSSTSVADRNKVYFDDVSLVGPPSLYSIYLPLTIKNASGPTQ